MVTNKKRKKSGDSIRFPDYFLYVLLFSVGDIDYFKCNLHFIGQSIEFVILSTVKCNISGGLCIIVCVIFFFKTDKFKTISR